MRRKEKLSTRRSLTAEDADFAFENQKVKVVANRDEAGMELVGLKVGPFEEGREYEVHFWVAQELERAGVARPREEDRLDEVKLHKAHWKERVQPSNKVSPLPSGFYPLLRRYLTHIQTSKGTPDRAREYEKSTGISRDIVNSRLKKIVSLASSPPLASHMLEGLTQEERNLYHHLHEVISKWRDEILKRGWE